MWYIQRPKFNKEARFSLGHPHCIKREKHYLPLSLEGELCNKLGEGALITQSEGY